ncbi:class I SAM-dependent methyltransferase [Castellaniella defragrans]|uniref:class I SAM-dependent methyltransferase n=1 Tax=Castellaniella defragrans TaxID=75697 RepID=UPI002AFF40CC|nr:class I SAM-dependent methyltransferase [Castellaniella defragrans]
MSQVWNEGYFTDVGYTYGYFREINPVFQRFCLLTRGFAAPTATASSSHCELGFGQGVSVSVHATATPGEFVGTDFNPAHAAHANGLAIAGGSGAKLYDDSFEQLLNRHDLPQFDSISLHGIWTWVSRENHRIIAEFVRRQLKPGGTLYISYNCFPGWSPAYPLRQLFALHDRFGNTPNGPIERVEAALKFSERLLNAKPGYLAAAPQLKDKLEQISKQNKHYLAHEYFNREWNCMYFTDVVDALAPAKVDFACTAVPLDGVDAVNLSSEAIEMLNSIDHPVLREQARDYFVNQQFRKDLFVRGAIRITPLEQRELLLATRFVLLKHETEVSLKVSGAAGEAVLQETVYKPILNALADKQYAPKKLRELCAKMPDGVTYPQIQQAIVVLVHMGAVAPCQEEWAEKDVRKRCAQLNKHLCERALVGSDVEVLASPVLGGGLPIGRFPQLFILAQQQGKKTAAELVQFGWGALSALGQRLVKEGKTLETDAENIAEITVQAEVFLTKQLPILKALQIV